MVNYLIYWKDVYVGLYRKGVSYASKDGLKTACGRNMGPDWDGGYNSVKIDTIECKSCTRALKSLQN